MSLSNGATKLTWISFLLSEISLEISNIPFMMCENLNAQHMAKKPNVAREVQAVKIDYHLVRDQLLYKKFAIGYYSYDDQIAYIFTKPLGVSWFQSLKVKFMIFPKP